MAAILLAASLFVVLSVICGNLAYAVKSIRLELACEWVSLKRIWAERDAAVPQIGRRLARRAAPKAVECFLAVVLNVAVWQGATWLGMHT
jgi:hypothetical protein